MSVINDLVNDHRVFKTCHLLLDCGYEVTLVGRVLKQSLPIPDWPYQTRRIRLLINKGPLFYVSFNLRLFLFLLFRRADLLYANDLDTLGPNYLISKFKSIPLIYDSHELFCEVPELQNRPFKRKLWETLEASILPRLSFCVTVNESIAKRLQEKYKVPFTSVRNIPDLPESSPVKTREDLGLPADKKIILLQGAGINVDRGAEELILAMPMVHDALLLVIGSGDVWPKLRELVVTHRFQDSVKLIPKLQRSELLHYTRNADLGLSIDKNTNPNYYYSLPNKLFDYLHCGVPVLVSRLPEIEKIVAHYAVGEFIENHRPQHLSDRINELLTSGRLEQYKHNTIKARKELNWSLEKEKLRSLLLLAQAGSLRKKP